MSGQAVLAEPDRSSNIASSRFLTLFAASSVVIGVGLRLYLAYTHAGNYDQQSYEIVAGIARRGGNVYAETSRYNYSPVWFHVLLFLKNISLITGLAFPFVIRAFLTLVDLLCAWIVGLLGMQATGRPASLGFSLFFLNP